MFAINFTNNTAALFVFAVVVGCIFLYKAIVALMEF